MRIQREVKEKKILEKIVAISEEFLQFAGSELNYQKITDNILDISGAKYASFNLYDEDGSKFRTVAFSAPEGIIKKVSSLLGFKLLGKKWDRDPVRAERIKSHTITRFSTLSELVGDLIAKPVVSLLEKTFNIGEVVFVKILKENVIIGYFNLFMPGNVKFKNDNYVEIYTRQVGLLITRKKATEALQESEERYRMLFRTIDEGVVLIAPDGQIVQANAAAEHILGLKNSEIKGRKYDSPEAEILRPDGTPMPPEEMAGPRVMREKRSVKNVVMGFKRPDGVVSWVNVSAAPLLDEAGEINGVVGTFQDITERKNTESEIRYLSYHDQLTGMYNRRFAEEEIKRLDTKRQLPISVIIGDINSLKLTNDTFGHSKGDKILKGTAELLKRICRYDDILSRWGGDEFVILLPKTSITDSEEIVQRIKKECKKLIIQKIPLSLSIGIATKIEVGQDMDEIIIEAESNMYKNKLVEKESNASSIIFALEQALYEKSNETMEHAFRIKDFAIKLGESIKLQANQLDELSLLASLHDIGKVAIPETILLKEGKLTEKEWAVIKRHPEIGFNIAQSSPQIIHIAKFILACHENWDGSGYPKGLAGESIPIVSRVISIADAYDVMTSERIYKKAMSKDAAIEEIKRCAGTQFDPVLVNKFIEIISN